jgi:hypothetical protein
MTNCVTTGRHTLSPPDTTGDIITSTNLSTRMHMIMLRYLDTVELTGRAREDRVGGATA